MNSWWEGTSLRRRVYLGLVLLLVAFAAGLAWDPKGLRHHKALGQELGRLEGENARLGADVENLRRRARALQAGDDPRKAGDAPSLERPAREKGFIKDDEVLFELH
jgi:cell division protein FtsB